MTKRHKKALGLELAKLEDVAEQAYNMTGSRAGFAFALGFQEGAALAMADDFGGSLDLALGCLLEHRYNAKSQGVG